jgi:hypothetical protein
MKIAPNHQGEQYKWCPACNCLFKPYHARQLEEHITYCACEPTPGDSIDFDAIYDWRGNLAKVGDIIAYPYLNGRSAMISTGILTRIYASVPKSYGSQFNTRLTVIPVDRSYWNLWNSDPDTPIEKRKPSTLQYWDRFILLEERSVKQSQ